MSDQRHSEAESASLIEDEDERARREAANAVAQFDRVLDLIDAVERDGRPFRLRISVVQDLHRLALAGLSAYAGNWRPGDVRIGQSAHQPPKAHLVAGLMEEMCDWINERWTSASPITLCAYAMWRLNGSIRSMMATGEHRGRWRILSSVSPSDTGFRAD